MARPAQLMRRRFKLSVRQISPLAVQGAVDPIRQRRPPDPIRATCVPRLGEACARRLRPDDQHGRLLDQLQRDHHYGIPDPRSA
ncbi:MAG TPA: hypothetical protein VMA77_14630 [Solirubrobacteraceae bacterium]|nr:hypothetical protein [Solirubrobacteraceae bacterium]